MPMPRLMVSILPAIMMFLGGAVFAQDFPARLIRIVTSPPGGGNDFTARLIKEAGVRTQ